MKFFRIGTIRYYRNQHKECQLIFEQYLSEHDYKVEKLLNNFQAKYTQRNAMHALKSLNYFEDVNLADWPELLKNKKLSWKEIRNCLDKACKDYIKTIS